MIFLSFEFSNFLRKYPLKLSLSKMKLLLTLIIAAGSHVLSANISPSEYEHNLTAVSNNRIAEILYSKIRKQNPHVDKPLDMSPDFKCKICHYITGSNFFTKVLELERVSMISMYEKIKGSEPKVFQSLYKPLSGDSKHVIFEYINTTQLINVFPTDQDRETVEEYAFTCVAIEPEDDDYEEQIKVYFISNEYNLSENPEFYVPGRFIFAYSNDEETEIDVFAVAEVPAKSLCTTVAQVEDSYLKNRKGNEPEKNEIDDPICKLKRRERLRLCTLVLSSENFENELKFTPEYEYIDRKTCMKEEISFEDPEIRSEVGENVYEEWLISCRPDEYYATYQKEYFLSRVYNSTTEVFVYHRGQNQKLFLDNRFANVRFKI